MNSFLLSCPNILPKMDFKEERHRSQHYILSDMHAQKTFWSIMDRDSIKIVGTHTVLRAKVMSKKDGVLVPLKTPLELASRDKVEEVWVIGVEAKRTSATLSLIRNLLPDEEAFNFQHLRRVVKLEDVPKSVRTSFQEASMVKQEQNPQLLHSFFSSMISKVDLASNPEFVISSIGEIGMGSSGHAPSLSAKGKQYLLLIICPVHKLSLETLLTVLSFRSDVKNSLPIIISTSVPLLAPTSSAQAKQWTETHWPTIYNRNNPFGPHPCTISRAQVEVEKDVSKWMGLACELARESCEGDGGLERGESIAAVVVERNQGLGRVVAAARDLRWLDWTGHRVGKGNPAAHAVMRVIAMVATVVRQRDWDKKKKIFKESQFDSFSQSTPSGYLFNKGTEDHKIPYLPVGSYESLKTRNTRGFPGESLRNSSIFYESPLSTIENQYLDPLANQNGYLCQDLEIYLTHESCVMCSMAIIHSRFGRVIFMNRMNQSGGLTADGLLGYGLFWRKELNWNMLAWQWHSSFLEAASFDDPDLEA